MSNTLFLDIDGVFNSGSSFVALGGGQRMFDPVSVRLIERVISKAEPTVVWSTSWRGREGQSDWSENILQVFLNTPLVDMQIWRRHLQQSSYLTPRLPHGYRGKEIMAWIQQHGVSIQRSVIIDDDGDMEPLMHRLVQTNFERGFGFPEYQRVCEMFGVDPV